MLGISICTKEGFEHQVLENTHSESEGLYQPHSLIPLLETL